MIFRWPLSLYPLSLFCSFSWKCGRGAPSNKTLISNELKFFFQDKRFSLELCLGISLIITSYYISGLIIGIQWRKMSFEEKRFCFRCKLDAEQLMKKNKRLKTCSFCKIAQYCGQECQRQDFKDNHERICIEGFKHMRDLGEKAKNILEEKGHNLDRSSLQVHIFLHSFIMSSRQIRR